MFPVECFMIVRVNKASIRLPFSRAWSALWLEITASILENDRVPGIRLNSLLHADDVRTTEVVRNVVRTPCTPLTGGNSAKNWRFVLRASSMHHPCVVRMSSATLLAGKSGKNVMRMASFQAKSCQVSKKSD